MKLHVGAGSCYLRGWCNVDLPFPNVFLASDRPDLVEALITDESDYYGRHKEKTIETLRAPIMQEMVCDRYGSFDFLPVAPGSVDELLSVECWEHMSVVEAHSALVRIKTVLKPCGILRLDVPDSEETLRLYRKTGDPFYARHLMGPRNSDRGFHISYNRELLTNLVQSHGFVLESEESTITHVYPAFALRFRLDSA